MHHRYQCAVNDADDSQRDYQRRIRHRRIREERQTKSDDAVGAHFQQHAGQNNTADCRCLNVRVWQPCMEWEQRTFNRECDKKRQEQEIRVRESAGFFIERQQREAIVVLEVKVEDANEHECAACHCVEDKLDGGVNAPLSAPNADEKIHRNQHGFPEHEEEEQIQGAKHAEHPRLQGEQRHHKAAESFLHRIPGGQDAHRGDERRQ